ncbi:hypothetical protein DPMN_086957 [Dreissena polymorpha]|uniref:B box-type domain-containing protein n=1 Tax=Dreissena polymorpha TaxID=45954 RepID=A0A9D4QV18_DREPO|nr:hypothetical protein DPMN_086957 [Dreissena polymorpha]
MAEKGSDLLYDFCCNVCEEKNVNNEAMFYCQKCSKGLCEDCEGLHKMFYSLHIAYEKGEIDKWPATTKSFDDLQFCQHHSDRLIEMFCEDHGKLCCAMCLFHEHRPCVKLVLITEKTQAVYDAGDFHQIFASINDAQQKLETAIDDTQEFLKQLQDSYEKASEEIKGLRQKVNDILDELERKTVHSLDNMLQKLKHSIQSNEEKCLKAKDGFKKISDAINKIKKNPKDLSFIAYQKALEMVSQAENLLKTLIVHRYSVVTFNSNPSIYGTLSGFLSLGNIECAEIQPEKSKHRTLEFTTKSLYNIQIASDTYQCEISGICELPGGDILIADQMNKRVKLIDAMYKVVAHLDMPTWPWDMCSISHSEVAVTVSDSGYTKTVQLLKVNNRQIVKERVLKFPHHCFGISRYKEHLFISSNNALYKYTMDGQLVKKIYEDTSHIYSVYKCAVSPDGSRLYVTSCRYNKLLILSMDGTVLSSLDDPALRGPTGIHVSETGLLLICGHESNNVVQMDDDGGVVKLASKEDCLDRPESVYYSASTGRLIVGTQIGNILVAEIKC